MRPTNECALADCGGQGAEETSNLIDFPREYSTSRRLQLIVSDADTKPVRVMACVVVRADHIEGALHLPPITLPELPS